MSDGDTGEAHVENVEPSQAQEVEILFQKMPNECFFKSSDDKFCNQWIVSENL